ncbi:acyl-CoA N-acyltransferase [Xylariaceae sp. AK1471]|nr:acyl-CoA N-acyltransferase [Xylariaceae sp. AK1471]
MSKSWITVTTTLPQSLGPHDQCKGEDSHPEIRTERLIIRPLTQSDLVALHRLRSQPEFMKHTTTGRPDRTMRETQVKLDSFINAPKSPDGLPFPTYFGIFLNTTGELIGDGGIHTLASPACGWPELGCKFAREHLGRGYGTEFLRAFTTWWWALPRYKKGAEGEQLVLVRIPIKHMAVEQLYAWVTPDNHASQRMVIKTGLEQFITWQHPIKKITVLGWRQSRYRRSAYPSKL